ncbi:site-specific integrase [Mesorhizobium australicum]
MFNIAKREWGIPLSTNPLSDLRIRAPDNKRERRLRKGELERLISAAKKTRNCLIIHMVLFALETGMRRGELLALSWQHINLDRCSVTIPMAKNGHSRTIPLTPRAVALVRSFGRARDEVFPISANALRLSWTRLTKRAGIGDLHFHDLRHEAISRFFEFGLTVPEVALISGHRDVRMLMRYAHANISALCNKISSTPAPTY